MFVQQPIRVRAVPNQTQLVAASIDPFMRTYYKNRAETLSSDRVSVLRIEFLNPVVNDTVTQLDMIVSAEAQSLDVLSYFMRDFARIGDTGDFTVLTVE